MQSPGMAATKDSAHLSDLERDPHRQWSVIEDLQSQLEGGSYRILKTSRHLSHSWFNFFVSPRGVGADEAYLSNTEGVVPEDVWNIKRDFLKEIELIERRIPEPTPEELPAWQRRYGLKMNIAHARTLRAFRVWEQYAVPIRARNGWVFHVYTPYDALGDVPVTTAPIDYFLAKLCLRVAEHQRVLDKWKRRAKVGWTAFAIVAFLLLFAAVN